MKRNFVIDQDVELDGHDFLNTKVYSEALKKMILNAPSNKPFTIGLFGEWGSGKSSIIKTAKKDLEKDKKTKFALFDAWKYSEDAFRRSFIISLSKDLNVELDKSEYNLYENYKQKIENFKIKLPKWSWIVGIGALIILTICYTWIPWFKSNALSLLSLLSLSVLSSSLFLFFKDIIDKDIVAKILEYFHSLAYTKYDEERPLMFSPEQFSNAFDHIIEKSTSNINKLVIVIDNIDRCEKHYATELLSTIKGFLESNEKVLFIMPVDESSLKRHLRSAFGADDREADEFLRKFFNTTLKIKPYQPTEIYVFAKEINKKYSLNFSDYTLDLVSKEYASNPRRIIQMFNNLSSELECYSDDEFTKQYETLICKLLIAREEFPGYYALLSKNPYLISANKENFEKLHPGIWNKNLENFLRKTSVISETVDIKIISQILSNSVVFGILPKEIEDYIDNLQISEIKTFIDGDSEKLNIVTDYLIQQLDSYKERNIIGNVFVNSFDILMDFEQEKRITQTVNKRVEEIVKSTIEDIFELKKDLEGILKYGASLKEKQQPYIVDKFISVIDVQISVDKPSQKWLDALRSGIKVFEDKRILKRLAKTFRKAYVIDRTFLDRGFSSDKISSLVNTEFYLFIIERLATLNSDDIYFEDLKFTLENDNPSQEIIKSIINRINEIYSEFANKNVQEITAVILNINSLLSLLNIDLGASNELQIISNTIGSNRAIYHPSYPNQRQYDTVENYVSQVISGQDNIEPLLDFYFNIYKLSLGHIDIRAILNQIVTSNNYQELLNTKLTNLNDSGFDIKPLSSVIIQDSSYTNKSLDLLKEVFIGNPDNIPDELKREKLSEILTLVENEDARKEDLTNFLELISSDNKIKEMLSVLISSKNKVSIMKFSKPLQSLAIDKVLDGDKIFDFSSNIEFLKVIAETGSKKHVAKLVKDIISKLQHGDENANAIAVILEIKNISTTDSNRIIHELENQSIDNISKEQIKEIIDNLKKIAKN